MPAKNALKEYLENGYYHLYNRGVEKRIIFLDSQDYSVFLSYLKEYLIPKNEKELQDKISDPKISWVEKEKAIKILRLNNFSKEITLLAYCLMPNHFHFFVKQGKPDSIHKFMSSLCTRYTMYFNKKYKRVGSLYQGVYKAVLVSSDEQFVYLSKYIHQQALFLKGETLKSQPSSYDNYLGLEKSEWVHPEKILEYFSKSNNGMSYKAFVEEKDSFLNIREIILEDD
nr:transposase [Candidatus Levybacteria bacterium]